MGEKNGDKALVKVLAEEIDLLQDKLLADKRYKLLVILQGMDELTVFAENQIVQKENLGELLLTDYFHMAFDTTQNLSSELKTFFEFIQSNRSNQRRTPCQAHPRRPDAAINLHFSTRTGLARVPRGILLLTQTSHIIIEQNHRKSDVANIKIA